MYFDAHLALPLLPSPRAQKYLTFKTAGLLHKKREENYIWKQFDVTSFLLASARSCLMN